MASPVADTYSAASGAAVYGGRYPPGGRLSGEALLSGMLAEGGMAALASELSGAAVLDGVTAGGSFGMAISERTALVGDSLTSLDYGSLHPYTWANGIAAGALKFVANCGVSSNTIANMTARMDNSYTDASPGLAGLSPLGRVFVRAGTNNFRGGQTIDSSTQAAYIALFSKCLSYADEVIVFAVPPVGATGDTDGHGIPAVNAWLSSYCAATDGMVFIDDCVTVDDGSGNWVPAYDSGDHIHFSPAASYQMGIDGGIALAAHLGAGYPSPLSTDAADKYPAEPQWVTNHVMAGTGGTNGLGSGQVPTGWGIGSYGAGFAATSAIVAADGGDSNQTPWMRVTPTQMGSTGYLGLGCSLASDTIDAVYPDELEVMYEIRFNSFDGSKASSISCYIYGTSNEQLSPPMKLYLGIGTVTQTVVARCAIRRSGSRVSHAGATMNWALNTVGAFTGSMGSFDIRCLTVRG